MSVNISKSEKALKTIGEVAEEINVATHVLRFWESKFSQINPQKRRGRRYYRLEDIIIIKKVQYLLYQQGYTTRGVQKFLSSNHDFDKSANYKTELPLESENPESVDELTLNLFDQDYSVKKTVETSKASEDKEIQSDIITEETAEETVLQNISDVDSVENEPEELKARDSKKQDLEKILYEFIKARNSLEQLSYSED